MDVEREGLRAAHPEWTEDMHRAAAALMGFINPTADPVEIERRRLQWDAFEQGRKFEHRWCLTPPSEPGSVGAPALDVEGLTTDELAGKLRAADASLRDQWGRHRTRTGAYWRDMAELVGVLVSTRQYADGYNAGRAALDFDAEALAETLYRYYPGPSREEDWPFWQTRARNMIPAIAYHRAILSGKSEAEADAEYARSAREAAERLQEALG